MNKEQLEAINEEASKINKLIDSDTNGLSRALGVFQEFVGVIETELKEQVWNEYLAKRKAVP